MMRCETGDMRQDTWDRRCETRAGNLLIRSLLIHSFCHFAQIKWALWAMHSDRSRQISDREWIALVAQRKWATVSDSLRWLRGNDRCERIAHFAHQKWATMSNLLRSLRGNERCERIAHFAHQKWANEGITHFFERIAHLLIFGQKTIDSLGNQMSQFPALWDRICRRCETGDEGDVRQEI